LAFDRDVAYLHTRCCPVLARKPNLEYALRPVSTARQARSWLFRPVEGSRVALTTGRPGNIDLYPRIRNINHIARLATAALPPGNGTTSNITTTIKTGTTAINTTTGISSASVPGRAANVCNGHTGSVASIISSDQPWSVGFG
jgi:hypothetical protein